jgi:glycosyltransferase involved in cell wall biosynthesis
MRIAHVVSTFPPYRGGVGRMAAEYATRLRARGHGVEVFTPREPRADDAPPWIHQLRSPLRIGNAAFTPSLAWRLGGFDLVHLHYPFFGGAEPVLLGLWRRPVQPLVVSYHMDAVAEGVRGALFRLHARVVLPRIVARANRVLVSSSDYASQSALAGVGDAVSRAEVHPYGVDTERFHPGDEPALRERLGAAPGEPTLIFVSRLDAAHHFKGLAVLFDALTRLVSRRWRLLIVGDGPLRMGFERAAATRGLGGRVVFAGDVSDQDLPSYYRAADVHVCPSTGVTEAFSLVSLEAAASGIPTVASSLPGVRMLVLDGRTGLHAAPGDPLSLAQALATLTDQAGLRRSLGSAARTRAESYGWAAAIDRLERTYRAVIEGPKAGSGRLPVTSVQVP